LHAGRGSGSFDAVKQRHQRTGDHELRDDHPRHQPKPLSEDAGPESGVAGQAAGEGRKIPMLIMDFPLHHL